MSSEYLEIPRESVEAAIDLVENYFKAHAMRVYGMLDVDPRAERAATISEKLIQVDWPESFSASDVTSKHWKGMRSSKDVIPALEYLEERGHGRLIRPDVKSGQGRPGYRFTVNPKLKSFLAS